MKIILYTIADDQYCKAEKEYLASKNLSFEEKNLETDRKVLTEMLAASNNFAGVPFTIITKDDGSEVKLKGFTREDFDKVFEVPSIASFNSDINIPTVTEPEKPVVTPPTPPTPPASPTPTTPSPAAPYPMTPSVSEPTAPVAVPPPTVNPPAPAVDSEDKLGSIIDSLAASSTPALAEPASTTPQIPDFPAR